MKKAKLVLVGDAGVGKTCIAQRISKNEFSNTTAATVGAANLTVPIKTNSVHIEFNICDTAGQERYRSLTPMYFAGAQVAILVFDLTSPQSFANLNEFVELLQQKAPPDCVLVLVGNKSDLKDKRAISRGEAENYSRNIGSIFYCETSAATGAGVRSLFEDIAESGMISFKAEDSDYVTDFSKTKNKSKGCC
jgi:small GTP-binding protein